MTGRRTAARAVAAVCLTTVAGCADSEPDVADQCRSDVLPAMRTAASTMVVRDGEVSLGFVTTVDQVLDASGGRAQLEGSITNGADEMCLMVVRGQRAGGPGGAVLVLTPDKTTSDPVYFGQGFNGGQPPAWVATLRPGEK
jgi:hypothetical protein